ncbi:MAG TPA: hypothetical protein P5228_04790 [Bacteroidales bacterium]|nr:hypothetical protein [Bacteroidales bacterium]HRZ48926.1 hypothetical protein [Bacteroidales bacterium]
MSGNVEPLTVLLVAATRSEVSLLPGVGSRDTDDPESGLPEFIPALGTDLLITGPGIAATVFHTTRALILKPYRLAMNLGVAGSFVPEFEPGMVLRVIRDRFADLGSESSGGFTTGENLPFTGLKLPPYNQGWLEPETVVPEFTKNLPEAIAISSDTIHTDPASVNRLRVLFQPGIETMEGAAFFYAAAMLGVPCLQIRAVSNRVAPRKKAGWDLETAVENLCRHVTENLCHL